MLIYMNAINLWKIGIGSQPHSIRVNPLFLNTVRIKLIMVYGPFILHDPSSCDDLPERALSRHSIDSCPPRAPRRVGIVTWVDHDPVAWDSSRLAEKTKLGFKQSQLGRDRPTRQTQASARSWRVHAGRAGRWCAVGGLCGQSEPGRLELGPSY